jgi:hypothetical protein
MTGVTPNYNLARSCGRGPADGRFDRGLGIFHRFGGRGGRDGVIESVLPTVVRLDNLAVETRNPCNPASRFSLADGDSRSARTRSPTQTHANPGPAPRASTEAGTEASSEASDEAAEA